MNTFSVVMPVYSELDPLQSSSGGERHFRAKTVQRAIKSILNQQYPHWELILVDDGCADGITPEILDKFAAEDGRIKVIHQENQNRAVARNAGMEAATNDWICWLDCDDEYVSHYLRELNQAIKEFPEYKIFNFGSLIYWPDHRTSIRSIDANGNVTAFKPAIEGSGHEWFRSGQIGTGSFIFRKDLWVSDKKYRIPDEVNPYQFAAASKFPMRFSPNEPDRGENPETIFEDGVYRHGTSLGNPWGDDFLQFYLLTRDNHSKPLDVLLYIQYPRSHEEVYEHFGERYEVEQ